MSIGSDTHRVLDVNMDSKRLCFVLTRSFYSFCPQQHTGIYSQLIVRAALIRVSLSSVQLAYSTPIPSIALVYLDAWLAPYTLAGSLTYSLRMLPVSYVPSVDRWCTSNIVASGQFSCQTPQLPAYVWAHSGSATSRYSKPTKVSTRVYNHASRLSVWVASRPPFALSHVSDVSHSHRSFVVTKSLTPPITVDQPLLACSIHSK